MKDDVKYRRNHSSTEMVQATLTCHISRACNGVTWGTLRRHYWCKFLEKDSQKISSGHLSLRFWIGTS